MKLDYENKKILNLLFAAIPTMRNVSQFLGIVR